MDVNEFGWLCGWVMECQEKGYITKEQLGFQLKWGDVEGADRLIQMISKRQGFGDLLAEGVKRASEKLGGAAAECAIYTGKGASPARPRSPGALGGDARHLHVVDGHHGDGQPRAPDRARACPARINPFDGEAGRQAGGRLPRPPQLRGLARRLHLHHADAAGELCRALSAATGWDYTRRRGHALGPADGGDQPRRSTLRCGHRRRTSSARPSATAPRRYDGPAKGQAISAQWETMVDIWYAEVGYDRKSGKPLPKTLKDLGLDWLAKELWGSKA